MALRVWPALLALACSSESLTPGAPASNEAAEPVTTGAVTPPPADTSAFQAVAAYPPGPYGRGLGAVIENLTFLGWHDPVAAGYDPALLEAVSLSDFYDPNGQRTKIIVLNASAVWCSVCRTEMHDIQREGTYQSYLARGAQLVGTLFEDDLGGPATPNDLKLWGSASVRTIEFPLLVDPGFKTGVYFTSDATPLNLIIDATTMRIVNVMMGYDSTPGSGLWGMVDRELERRAASP